jgi:hypothetical protein
MSGGGNTGPLLESERTDARRFCGYPAYGDGADNNAGWRFYQAYGALEYRLTNLAPAELAVLRSFLATLNGLEAAVPGAGTAMDTDQAAVWTRNRTEAEDRARLLAMWSRRLCGFLGIPPGPALAGANTVAQVV